MHPLNDFLLSVTTIGGDVTNATYRNYGSTPKA